MARDRELRTKAQIVRNVIDIGVGLATPTLKADALAVCGPQVLGRTCVLNR